MAKKKVNKSEQIRERLAADPDASTVDVAKALKVSKALVYNVKSRLTTGGGKKKRRRTRKAGRPAARVSRNGAVAKSRAEEPLVQAARLIKACGGVEEAELALRTAGVIATTLA